MAADACADGEVDDAAIDFEAAVERMEAYLQAIPKFPTAMQELEWRNGWYDAISRAELAAGRADPLPRHSAALRQLGL